MGLTVNRQILCPIPAKQKKNPLPRVSSLQTSPNLNNQAGVVLLNNITYWICSFDNIQFSPKIRAWKFTLYARTGTGGVPPSFLAIDLLSASALMWRWASKYLRRAMQVCFAVCRLPNTSSSFSSSASDHHYCRTIPALLEMNTWVRKRELRDIYQSRKNILEATMHTWPGHSAQGLVGGTPETSYLKQLRRFRRHILFVNFIILWPM